MLTLAGGLAGSAIDFGSAVSAQTAMQTSLDAVTLRMAWDAADIKKDKLGKEATKAFNASFSEGRVVDLKLDASFDSADDSRLTLKVSGKMKTSFLNLLGIPTIDIGATSETRRGGGGQLQVALVLDNTGSMAQNKKMVSLKLAAHSLLSQLEKSASKDGDVMVAIVPFANAVNVGPENKAEDWLDWSYFQNSGGAGWGGTSTYGSWNTTSTNNTSTWSNSTTSWGGFQTNKTNTTYSWTSGTGKWNTTSGNFSGTTGSCSFSTCWGAAGTWSASASSHAHWQGCVMDRAQDYDTDATSPDPSNKDSLFPAIFLPACPPPVMGLTYNWSQLDKAIDAMTPQGTTNQTIGLAWGLHALTPGAPFDNPEIPAGAKRAIIMLTDGLNTENRWTTNQVQIDARTEKICDTIKSQGITLYTIQVKGNSDPTSDVLSACASDDSKFFALDKVSDIATAFNTIGSKLSPLRLSQ
jgi:Mg-chelatase subunit ChlD